MSASSNSVDDDWYIPNSDDESLETIELSKEQILEYILELDETGTLTLEWKCPGRRPPTPRKLADRENMPVKSDVNRMAVGVASNQKSGTGGMAGSKTPKNVSANDFDFNDLGDSSDTGPVSVGSAGVHKKFGAMSASGNRRHKLKSTDSGGSGSSAATVTVEKVMSDLMRQEKEDKKNIDEDRIARGLTALPDDEETRRKREHREEAFRQVANSVVSVASLRQQNAAKEKQKKLANETAPPSTDPIGRTQQHHQQETNHSAPYSSYSIACLSATDDRKPPSHSVVGATSKSKGADGYSLSVGSLSSNQGATVAAAVASTSVINQQSQPPPSLLANSISSAQLQESLQQQLMPNSFVSALDNLPTTLFSASSLNPSAMAAALQSSTSLLPTNQSLPPVPTCTSSQGILFASNSHPSQVHVNNQLGTSVAALTNQLQSQPHFFADSEASMLTNALSAVQSHDLLNLPNFPSDLTSTFDRAGDGTNWS